MRTGLSGPLFCKLKFTFGPHRNKRGTRVSNFPELSPVGSESESLPPSDSAAAAGASAMSSAADSNQPPQPPHDAKYWERRRKNNLAAKKSRDARYCSGS